MTHKKKHHPNHPGHPGYGMQVGIVGLARPNIIVVAPTHKMQDSCPPHPVAAQLGGGIAGTDNPPAAAPSAPVSAPSTGGDSSGGGGDAGGGAPAGGGAA